VRRSLLAAAVTLVVAGSPRAHAEGEACPSRASVGRALAELASKDPGEFPLEEALSELELADDGARYRVSVGGHTREYTDADRDCDRRARVAAVFIALVRSGERGDEPGDEEPQPGPPPAAAPAPQPAAPVPASTSSSRPPPRTVFLDAGGRLTFAPTSPGLVVVPGVELGGAYQPGALGARLTLAIPLANGTLAVGPATARIARYPLYAALRHAARFEPFLLAFDAGIEGALLAVRREGAARGTTRPDLGVRASVLVALASPRLAPFLSVLSEWVPERFGLALEPDGVVQKTPAFWLGLSAGAELTF